MHTRLAFAAAVALALIALIPALAMPQAVSPAVERGSRTAKDGFKNEDAIRDKFNNWRLDADAKDWLAAMDHRIAEIIDVTAVKPHGEKADVEVTIRTKSGEVKEGISIKLVSGASGFNQIDKRWLAAYARMWKMPPDVISALKLFTGDTPPPKQGRVAGRLYLNELDADAQRAVVDFFTANRTKIVAELFAGDGPHSARWLMVARKAGTGTRWLIRSVADAARYFGEGRIEITRVGNLRIGRITMQRKGGDGGRDTARMLQFKIDPTLLFEAK